MQLPNSLDKRFKEISKECLSCYREGDFTRFIELQEEKWKLLPEPKEDYFESFHVAHNIATVSIEAGDLEKARSWSKRLFRCDSGRAELGERDFVAGQVAFAAGKWELAREHFVRANVLSEGACFSGEDRRYYDFFLGKLDQRSDSVRGECKKLAAWPLPEEKEIEVDGDELDTELHHQVQLQAAEGDSKLAEGNTEEAIKDYRAAIKLLPEPQDRWEASTWLHTALGDAYFLDERFREAGSEFYNALNCPNGFQNPYVLVRLGQCLFELGNQEGAKEYLLRAFMLDGKKVFQGEDKKYFGLIRPLV